MFWRQNQSLDGLINEDGYTDAIASGKHQSIRIYGGVEDLFEAGFQVSSKIDNNLNNCRDFPGVWQLYFRRYRNMVGVEQIGMAVTTFY